MMTSGAMKWMVAGQMNPISARIVTTLSANIGVPEVSSSLRSTGKRLNHLASQ